MHLRPFRALALLALVMSASIGAWGLQGAQDCRAQLAAKGGAATEWIDPDTPAEACTVQKCTKYVADPGEASVCDVESPDLSSMQLVFSDEFNAEGRAFGVGAKDPRWTAERLW